MFSLSNQSGAFGINVSAQSYPHLALLFDRDLEVGFDHFKQQYGEVNIIKVPGNLGSLNNLDSDIFASNDVDATIRAFFERTSEATLAYVGTQSPFLTPLHRLIHRAITSRIGQLAIPPVSGGTEFVKGENFAVDCDADGRADYRTWQRHRDGEVFYVSAIKVIPHEWKPPYLRKALQFRYLLFCFPLPRSNLSVVLAPRNLAGGGMELSSREQFDNGLAGSYAVIPHGHNRISYSRTPLREHFVFNGVEGDSFRVLHSQFFGRQLLFRLDYRITMPSRANAR